jgi:hypothetical protein
MTEKQKDDLALALTNYLHREIIEECHEKYNISQEDMMMMNITSVNRARAFVDIMADAKMLDTFRELYALAVRDEWNAPENTEETDRIRKLIEEVSKTGKMF